MYNINKNPGGTMKAVYALLGITFIISTHAQEREQWVTILVHGTIGLGVNFNGRTFNLIKKDRIEGSLYERNVIKHRQNPYANTLQPLGPFGLHAVSLNNQSVDGAAIFSELYTAMAEQFGYNEKNEFYTFGWSGLISEKERVRTARAFYQELRTLIKEKTKANERLKVRLIGYSHGGTMFSNFARLRATEFCNDTFCIDETILIGVPLSKNLMRAFACPPFCRIYNLYSLADAIQRIDIFTSQYFLSERTFKGKEEFPLLTQIEFCYTAPLRPLPNKILPQGMRGIVTQSPGHVEWWSFGWAKSMYRKNLDMYPLSAAVFVPFLLYASKQVKRSHIQVDLRPEEQQAYIQPICLTCEETICIPFMTQEAYQAFLDKALLYHPYYSNKCEAFKKLEATVGNDSYQYAS